MPTKQIEVPEGLHPATADLVARFATALAEKLHKAQEKYGYSDGWLENTWMFECQRDLYAHVLKGDPRDVAAYCAFAWHHGWPTSKQVEPKAVRWPPRSIGGRPGNVSQDY